jgi:hypothetical protein
MGQEKFQPPLFDELFNDIKDIFYQALPVPDPDNRFYSILTNF